MIWGERVGVPVVKQKMGADPASVAYDTLSWPLPITQMWLLLIQPVVCTIR